LREEFKVIRDESLAIRAHLDGAMNRLAAPGSEVARVHRHWREANAAAADRRASERFVHRRPPAFRLRAFPAVLGGVPMTQGRDSNRRLPRARPRLRSLPSGWPQVAASDLFDAMWYEREHSGSRAAGQSALEHYLQSGWREGWNPNALFHESGIAPRTRPR
jgi:hypothetical protein